MHPLNNLATIQIMGSFTYDVSNILLILDPRPSPSVIILRNYCLLITLQFLNSWTLSSACWRHVNDHLKHFQGGGVKRISQISNFFHWKDFLIFMCDNT